MATHEVTTHPFPAQTGAASTSRPNLCCHCQRPITKRIISDRKAYCGKLCAAVRLIADAYVELKLDDDCGLFDVSFRVLLDSAFRDERPKHPVTARWSDAVDVQNQLHIDDVIFVIADDGTPDLIPDPLDLDASQICIEAAIERIAAA